MVDYAIKMDPNTGRSRGFRFILFRHAACMEKVLDQKERRLDGVSLTTKRP